MNSLLEMRKQLLRDDVTCLQCGVMEPSCPHRMAELWKSSRATKAGGLHQGHTGTLNRDRTSLKTFSIHCLEWVP